MHPSAPSRRSSLRHLQPDKQQLQPFWQQQQLSVREPWRRWRQHLPLWHRLVPVQKRLWTDLCTFCTDHSISGNSRCLPAPGQRPRGARLQSQFSVTASSSITPFQRSFSSLFNCSGAYFRIRLIKQASALAAAASARSAAASALSAEALASALAISALRAA